MSIFKDLLLYVITAFCSLIFGLGGYWARGVDRRLDQLESELEREKLQSSAKLARLEALLEKMAEQLDRIESELASGRRLGR